MSRCCRQHCPQPATNLCRIYCCKSDVIFVSSLELFVPLASAYDDNTINIVLSIIIVIIIIIIIIII